MGNDRANPSLGKVDDTDLRVYDKPRFERTIEISKEQYDRILEFSADPKKHGFDMEYDFFSNACTDFAWGALNHAGLRPVGLAGEITNYEGATRVLDNIRAVNAIPQQVKGSELDKVQWNPMPKQTFREWMFTENGEQWRGNSTLAASGTPADPAHDDHARLNQIHQQVADLGAFGARNGNVSASLLALSKEQQFSRVDEVVLGEQRGDTAPQLFIVQGTAVTRHTSAPACRRRWLRRHRWRPRSIGSRSCSRMSRSETRSACRRSSSFSRATAHGWHSGGRSIEVERWPCPRRRTPRPHLLPFPASPASPPRADRCGRAVEVRPSEPGHLPVPIQGRSHVPYSSLPLGRPGRCRSLSLGVPSAFADNAPATSATTAVQRQAVAKGLYELAYSPKQNAVFVASSGGFGDDAGPAQVLRLNPATLAVETRIPLERKAFGVVLMTPTTACTWATPWTCR